MNELSMGWKARGSMIILKTLRSIYYPSFLLPVIVAGIAFLIVKANMPLDFADWWNARKAVLEDLALILIGGAFALSVIRCVLTKGSIFSLWISAFAMIIWFREIHWDWTSSGVYVGFLIWLAFAFFKYERLEPALSDRKTVTLLALILFTYFVAVTFDQQWWTDGDYFNKIGKLAGEVVEDLGHSLVLLLVLFGSRKPGQRRTALT